MILRRGSLRLVAALAWRTAAVAVAGTAAAIVLTTPAEEFRGAAPVSAAAKVRQADESALDAPAPAVADYSIIAARPLFYPTRTPWVPPAPPEEPPAVAAPSTLTAYTLVGVIVSGSMKSALIRPARDNKTVTLGEGEQLDGWTLREITRERLYFSAGDATYEMTRPKPSERQQ